MVVYKYILDMIYIGCCGFPVSRKRYYKEFSVVEVQQTFYRVPKTETMEKWRSEAPDDFEFIVKAWQGITHPVTSPTWRRYKKEIEGDRAGYGLLQYTEEVMASWRETLRALEALKGNKVLIQLPPKLMWKEDTKKDIKSTLREFLKYGYIIIVEPRHRSWYIDEVRKFFYETGIVHCVDPFKNKSFNAGGISYYRLHGIDGYNYGYKYTDEDLHRLVDMIGEDNLDKDCYIMFNNKYMYEDANRLRELISKEGLETT